MTRRANDESRFTPFSMWVRQYLVSSAELTVTNLDFILDHYKSKKIMLVEEKQNASHLQKGQKVTFLFLDQMLWHAAPLVGYEYWGFFLISFPDRCTMPGPGMSVNDKPCTCEEVQEHLSFKRKIFEPLFPKQEIDIIGWLKKKRDLIMGRG